MLGTRPIAGGLPKLFVGITPSGLRAIGCGGHLAGRRPEGTDKERSSAAWMMPTTTTRGRAKFGKGSKNDCDQCKCELFGLGDVAGLYTRTYLIGSMTVSGFQKYSVPTSAMRSHLKTKIINFKTYNFRLFTFLPVKIK